MRFSILILILLFSHLARATTFRRMPLEQMIEESSSAAEVKLIHKRMFMNEQGLIFTEHSFQVMEQFNLDKSDLDGEVLKLTLSGGTINGLTSFIDGAPEFALGERSFLLLKKIDQKLYLSNFTLGKYKVIQEGEKVFYVSSVFPTDADMGRVPKERMLELIREKFKISESKRYRPSKNAIISSAKNILPKRVEYRAPAQALEQKMALRLKLLLATITTFVVASFVVYNVFFKKEGR